MRKRLFDLIAAAVGLLLLAPVLMLVALWIRCDSPGPALYRQHRVGRCGVVFRIYKFRTMHHDRSLGAQLTVGRDKRITRAGHFLRTYKIDELPQLLNVLQGSMSLVGPRPEVPRYVACYPAAVREEVLSVAPGITDWASIEFSQENVILARASDPEQAYLDQVLPVKLALNQRYVRERSFWNDLRIIGSTLAAVVRPWRGVI
jgi:lipopolysaccharide/colanic/teichoic acid biosynthesis glycosyltransferase